MYHRPNMKSLLSTATIICYSMFSFLFTVLCPAVCFGFGTEDICISTCGTEIVEESSCCSTSCATSCEVICAETEPLAICSGAYGTQNSIRCAVDCPAPVKTPATVENHRHLKDIQHSVPTLLVGTRIMSQNYCFNRAEAPVASLHASIISTTVLRI